MDPRAHLRRNLRFGNNVLFNKVLESDQRVSQNNPRLLLANLLQSSSSTFSWESFLSFFAFAVINDSLLKIDNRNTACYDTRCRSRRFFRSLRSRLGRWRRRLGLLGRCLSLRQQCRRQQDHK